MTTKADLARALDEAIAYLDCFELSRDAQVKCHSWRLLLRSKEREGQP